MRTRCGTRCARMEVAPCLIILKVAKRPPSQKDCPRCGRLVLGLDAGQQNLGEVVAFELGRGVSLAVLADQHVFDLAVSLPRVLTAPHKVRQSATSQTELA